MKRLPKKSGPKTGYAVRVLANRFGVSARKIWRIGAMTLIRCPTNEAIRLLLGISQ